MFWKKFKKVFFAHQKLKKPLKKLHTYGSWEVFFFATPTAQNSPKQPKTAQNFISVLWFLLYNRLL